MEGEEVKLLGFLTMDLRGNKLSASQPTMKGFPVVTELHAGRNLEQSRNKEQY
jgi:hypothetical protein